MNNEFSGVTEKLSQLTTADCAVVLIGSAARGHRSEQSDIDILLVSTAKVSDLPVISGFHIKFSTEADFLRRLKAGEDFEAWCVRLGVTQLDRGVWARIRADGGDVWPKWETKVVHGLRRLFLASQMSKIGDESAAREELVFVLGHIARGLLLKGGMFPLSRPELADQVREIGYPHLADLHERLRNSLTPDSRALSLGLLYSKRLLVHLDRSIYKQMALEHMKAMQGKEARRAEFQGARNFSSRHA